MIDQPSLLDYRYPESPGYKERGGASRDAAKVVNAERLKRMVLDTLATHGELSADQAAALMKETPGAVRPRFSELKLAGLVEKTGRRAQNVSGCTAAVWRLTEKGRP